MQEGCLLSRRPPAASGKMKKLLFFTLGILNLFVYLLKIEAAGGLMLTGLFKLFRLFPFGRFCCMAGYELKTNT